MCSDNYSYWSPYAGDPQKIRVPKTTVKEGFKNEVLALHHNRDNWKVVKKKNIWESRIEPKIVGIFEVVSEPYTDSSRNFKSPPHLNETSPLRIKIRPLKLGELDFKPSFQN
ncbi:Hypothetical protein PAB2158 [Pyrococcus abyssi GE5]|uniref:EVE domain-containing protein n=1 Tax=Pyrococcus abyssi (strain GE5 / Orsay) TaxID=272844 RepID=Q9V1Y4_PYRAB|nr:Hypothetical protein PAB2158 [Pyrococcus abyssi GE5]CCE69668.1 TPA: hypothetical protein PAB2158 [Pyrococcus abyssi GE5]